MIVAFAVFSIVVGVVLGSISNTSSAALEGAVSAHLRLNHERVPGAWMRSAELGHLFGCDVYHYVRKMAAAGLVEMRREPGAPGDARGGVPSIWYRRNGLDGKDQILEKLKTF